MPAPNHIISADTLAGSFEGWASVCDRVMGGISDGAMRLTSEGVGVFEGTVRFDNYGGFSSIRKNLARSSTVGSFDASSHTCIVLTVQGAPKTYKLRFRTDPDSDGVSFEQEFTPATDRFSDITLPLDAFHPVFRGRRLDTTYTFDRTHIFSVGLMIASRQEGPFSLAIRSILFK